MWKWWSDINSAWRARDRENKVAGRDDGDWSTFDHGGPNGFLSVLKGLKHLYDLERNPAGSEGWHKLIGDVQWVLESILQAKR